MVRNLRFSLQLKIVYVTNPQVFDLLLLLELLIKRGEEVCSLHMPGGHAESIYVGPCQKEGDPHGCKEVADIIPKILLLNI